MLDKVKQKGCLGGAQVGKLPLLNNQVQACLNNWHYEFIHIAKQKPYSQFVVMAWLMCSLYSCTRLLSVSWDYYMR